jgi:acyl-CoA synthetase (NDP forming)
VVTVSTGEGSLIADLAPVTGVDLPPIPDDAKARIMAALPTMGYLGNPLDPWGAADPATAYGAAFEAMATSGAYDVLVLVHDFPYRSAPSEVATANDVTFQLLGATRDRPGILPVYVSLTSGEPPPETKAVLDGEGGGAPLLRGAVEAFRAIAAVARWEAWRARRLAGGPWRPGWPALAARRISFGADAPPSVPAPSAAGAPAAGPARRSRTLPELESLALLGSAGLRVVAAERVPDAAGAVAAARRIGGDVAIKLDAAGLAHKSDLGGVILGLGGDEAVRRAATTLLEIGRANDLVVSGLLVEPMVAPGLELIVGLRRDSQFGPVVLVGFGGTLAEVLDDVAIRLAPLDLEAALAMLDDLRGARLLAGVRGARPIDRDAVAAMLVALGRLGAERADLLEVDLNPVIATGDGAIAVDALVVLEDSIDGS